MSFDIFIKGEQKILLKPSAMLCMHVPERSYRLRGLPCCWAGENYGSHQVIQIPQVFSLPVFGAQWKCCWEVACVLQTPALKHPCSPPEKFLVKKGEIGAGILFSQSPSCHIFLLNLSHAVVKTESLPQPEQYQKCPFHWGPELRLVPLEMEVPGTVTNSQRQSYIAALIKASQGICIV